MENSAQSKLKVTLDSVLRRPVIAQRLEELAEQPAPSCPSRDTHVRNVMGDAMLFALLDGVKDAEVELLAIAAAYHGSDSAVESGDTYEREAHTAAEAMRAAGAYTESQIALVEQMILDTKPSVTREGTKQMPSTDLSCYLLDADRAEYGSEDFFQRLHHVPSASEDIALVNAYRELCAHSWYSRAGFETQERGKRKNIEEIEKRLRARSGNSVDR